MVKTDHLEFCSEETEGAINPVLDISDEWMKKLEIGLGVPTGMEDYRPSYDISTLVKKWEGRLREVAAQVEGI